MIPYLSLIIVPFLFHYIELKKEGNQLVLYVNNKNLYEKRSLALFVFFVILFLLLALRDETIGRDLATYKYHFFRYSAYSFIDLFYTWKESLFRVINWLIGRASSNYQVYLATVAIIVVAPIAYVYCKNPTHGYLKVIIFVNMSTFSMLFSGLRQSMSMAIGMIAYTYVKDKKFLLFSFLTIIALLIHHSGFIVFLMYPIYHMRLEKKHLVFIVTGIVILFILNNQIFGLLTTILSSYSDKYDASLTSTGAFGSLVLFAIFVLFSYVITDEKKMDSEGFGLRNYLVIAVAIQCFAPLNPLAMRFNYYYILFIPLAIGKCLDYPKDKYKSLAMTAEIVMCVFFTVYFVYNMYSSYITGISALDTVPYVPFWEG